MHEKTHNKNVQRIAKSVVFLLLAIARLSHKIPPLLATADIGVMCVVPESLLKFIHPGKYPLK